ncbi:MAG: acetylxylan esterase, partial [Armatimonadota bacterium]
DESKVGSYTLPDPLIFKKGTRVTSAKQWNQRRTELFGEFDREIYGRVPKVTPKVSWQVTETTKEMKGTIPVVTKKLVGHVDNSAYPAVTVDIQLTLATPEKAAQAVPVVMEFG